MPDVQLRKHSLLDVVGSLSPMKSCWPLGEAISGLPPMVRKSKATRDGVLSTAIVHLSLLLFCPPFSLLPMYTQSGRGGDSQRGKIHCKSGTIIYREPGDAEGNLNLSCGPYIGM